MKIICIGRNYADHISELNNERPSEPVIFMKPDTAVLAKQFPFVIPEFSNDVHHEVEVLVKINKVGKYIDAKFAHKYYDEIGLGIDFTARDLQNKLRITSYNVCYTKLLRTRITKTISLCRKLWNILIMMLFGKKETCYRI